MIWGACLIYERYNLPLKPIGEGAIRLTSNISPPLNKMVDKTYPSTGNSVGWPFIYA